MILSAAERVPEEEDPLLPEEEPLEVFPEEELLPEEVLPEEEPLEVLPEEELSELAAM